MIFKLQFKFLQTPQHTTRRTNSKIKLIVVSLHVAYFYELWFCICVVIVLWLCCDCVVIVLWLCCGCVVIVLRLCCGCVVIVFETSSCSDASLSCFLKEEISPSCKLVAEKQKKQTQTSSEKEINHQNLQTHTRVSLWWRKTKQKKKNRKQEK